MGYSTWVTLRNVFNLGPKIEKFGPPISKNPAQQGMRGRVECFSGLISHVLGYLKKKYKKKLKFSKGGLCVLEVEVEVEVQVEVQLQLQVSTSTSTPTGEMV